MMWEKSSSRMVQTKVSAPRAFMVRKRKRERAASAPIAATAQAIKSGWAFRAPMPPRRSIRSSAIRGTSGALSPMTESTVKEMIFGEIMSNSDTRVANVRLSAKNRFEPLRKCSTSCRLFL